MAEPVQPAGGGNEQALQAEIARLNKMILALMNRAERNASIHGSDFNLFHTAITLEDQVRRRTAELEAALLENEKITRALRESENRHRLLIENSPMCIHEIDMDGRIASMNRAGLGMMGFKDEDEVLGYLYLDAVSEADRGRIGELLAKAYAGETSHFDFQGSGPRARIFKSCFVPIKNKNGDVEKLMGITEDITERKQAEEQVRSFAFYDPLTQLANRRLLTDRLGQAMAAGKRSLCYGAVIFLDLDNFKPLNDTHGHEVGDLLLIEVAHRIARCVRETDTVARFGGDEFVVMLGELDVNKERSAEQAANVAEKIRVALAEPYLLVRNFCQLTRPQGSGKVASGNAVPAESGVATPVEHHCTSSIGVVLFAGNEASQEDILKWADMAMYQAKEGGRNRIRFFGGND
jgi:diguanylate cyclase (GGDEF)-like protein/PAS domain S-box-containing protein